MQRGINIFFLFLVSFYIKAQYNLVPNPSFENYSACPTASSQVSLTINWYSPTSAGTPDYYNTCAPFNSYLSVPTNPSHSNYQFPVSGNGYVGIACRDKFNPDIREYIESSLLSPLIANKCYFVSFYANLKNYSDLSCNNLGVYLSVNSINQSGSNSLLNYLPQVYTKKIINDTLNWTLISGILQTSGGEQYITIGNFFSDANTNVTITNTVSPNNAYYLIDNVFLTLIDSLPNGLPANAGTDKNIAIGDSVFIGQEISNLNCNWYILGGSQIATNTSGLFVKPTTPTTYVVEQNLCGNITYDTVFVMVSPTGIVSSSVAENSFKIYPNPSNGSFTINFNNQNGNYIVSVFDIVGQEVYNGSLEVKESLTNFNLDIKSGTYFVKIVNTNNKTQTIKKIIKQ